MILEDQITFSGGLSDRADRLRGDAQAQARMMADPTARVMALWHGFLLFDVAATGQDATDPPRLAWLTPDDPMIVAAPDKPVFMGLDAGGVAHFAADLSYLAPAEGAVSGFADQGGLVVSPTRRFIELRAVMAQIGHLDAGIAATAKGLFEWRRMHRFCGICGAELIPAHAGWRLDCRGCGRVHFPRTDPVVIMLVLDEDRVLLGRNAAWPERMYSLLAGFVEPGETIEDAVRREVSEEAGIAVGEVRYVTSQPWPFPASLMIGCVGRALSRDIVIDTHELEAAIWVSRSDMAAALAGDHPGIAPARKGAVAQAMLRAWVDGNVTGF